MEKDKKITNIKERILYISDYYKVGKEKFFEDLGLSYANFKGIQKKSALNSDAVAIILSKYSMIDPIWLLTGEGEMLKSSSAQETGTSQSGDDKDKEIEELKAEIQFLRGQNDVLREVLNLQSVNKQTGT